MKLLWPVLRNFYWQLYCRDEMGMTHLCVTEIDLPNQKLQLDASFSKNLQAWVKLCFFAEVTWTNSTIADNEELGSTQVKSVAGVTWSMSMGCTCVKWWFSAVNARRSTFGKLVNNADLNCWQRKRHCQSTDSKIEAVDRDVYNFTQETLKRGWNFFRLNYAKRTQLWNN